MANVEIEHSAWQRNTSINDYGGHLEKQNPFNVPTVNVKEEVSAQQLSTAVNDLVQAVRVANFCKFSVWMPSGDDITVTSFKGQMGVETEYAPDVNTISDGYGSMTFDSTYFNEYGEEIASPITFTELLISVNWHEPHFASVWAVGRTVYFRVWDKDGNAAAGVQATISVD